MTHALLLDLSRIMVPLWTEIAGGMLVETLITLLLGAIGLFHFCCGVR